jgi:C4-type Zn-finger protein
MPEIIHCPCCSSELKITVEPVHTVSHARGECGKCGYSESATDWSELDAKRALYEKIEEEVIKREKIT